MPDDPIDDLREEITNALHAFRDEHFDEWPADPDEEQLIDQLLGIVTGHFGL